VDGVTISVGELAFTATPEIPFVFGRSDLEGVVGLDPNDMGISSEAGSVEFQGGLWWVVNRSSKRPLMIEAAPGSPTIRLDPGERSLLSKLESAILVPGLIYTHRIDIVLPDQAIPPRGDSSRRSGTVTIGAVTLLERDREALAALFRGYLRPFPHRDNKPLSYQEAAELLGPEWNKVQVRKQVERLKEKFARSGLYFQGPRANDDLAEHLIAVGALTPADLELLEQTER
jgi:hypothetical protein